MTHSTSFEDEFGTCLRPWTFQYRNLRLARTAWGPACNNHLCSNSIINLETLCLAGSSNGLFWLKFTSNLSDLPFIMNKIWATMNGFKYLVELLLGRGLEFSSSVQQKRCDSTNLISLEQTINWNFSWISQFTQNLCSAVVNKTKTVCNGPLKTRLKIASRRSSFSETFISNEIWPKLP